jgi:malonyl CoA-acyl carrier protein transacylase
MKTFLFPGQGSQVRGMGGSLFEEFPEQSRKASDILGYSIRELCLEDPRKELNRTEFTQPALYVVNALSYFRRLEAGRQDADQFAGHSLGELNALMAAGCFDFETGLQIVKKRGEMLGRSRGGAMAAVMNLGRDQIAAILRDQGATGIDIVIHNSPLQSVIAGPKEQLAKVEPHLRVGNILYYPLNTSGAFHSRYMQPVSEEFRTYLAQIRFSPPQKPVIANVSARPYGPEDIIANLVGQIARPVLWCETIQHLLSLDGMEFEEIGHGDVLTKLLQSIRTQTATAGTVAASVSAGHSALEKVGAWNATRPVGTKVRSTRIQAGGLETRTEAVVLFGHRAAVYLKGYNGYFDLDELQPETAS